MATKKVGVKVYGIKWDTDGEKVKLPTTTEFKVSDLEQYLDLDEATDEEVADTIGEILTNEYEFCHDGFKWTWLTKKMTSFMENAVGWHGKAPKPEEAQKALEELEG